MYERLVRYVRFGAAHGPAAALRVAVAFVRRQLPGAHCPLPAAAPRPAPPLVLADAFPLLPPAHFRNWSPLAPPASGGVPRASLAHLVQAAAALPAQDVSLLVGVILPTHNRAGMLAAAIASVRAQSHARWRLYISDDASTDATAQLLDGVADDPRIRVLRSATRGGPAAARNLALAAAHADGAEVIAYLDSDNTYFPDYLAALAHAYARNPDAQCAYCAMHWTESQEAFTRFDAYDAGALLEMRANIDMNCFSHRAALGQRAGPHDAQLERHSDWDYVLRCTALAAPLPLPVFGVRYAAGTWPRITNTLPGAPDAYRVREKFAAQIGAGRRVLVAAYDYPQRSETYINSEIRWLVSRGFEVRAWRETPGGSPGVAQVPVHTGTIIEALDEFRPDAVHAHWFSVAEKLAPEAALRGIPLTVRGHSYDLDTPRMAGLMPQPALRQAYFFPHVAACWPGQPGISAMPCCFDGTRFVPRLPKPAAPRIVLRTAACLPTKDLELYFRVAARCPQFRFRLALARISFFPDLPRHFTDYNAALGNPVELCFDVEHAEIETMAAEASAYLHTTDPQRYIGMPVSVPEAMACGAVPLVLDHPVLRALAGPAGLAYSDEDAAVAHLQAMAQWDEATWFARAAACAEHAYAHHVDSVVLAPLGEMLAAVTQERAAA